MMDSAERQRQREGQSRMLRGLTHALDLSAQDHHSKSERDHFAVVGEGTRTAIESYRTNFDLIDWRS